MICVEFVNGNVDSTMLPALNAVALMWADFPCARPAEARYAGFSPASAAPSSPIENSPPISIPLSVAKTTENGRQYNSNTRKIRVFFGKNPAFAGVLCLLMCDIIFLSK